MKARAMHPEDEKAVAKMVEQGYVMNDEGEELPTVINSPDTDAELAIPFDTPPKEVKLHKKPLKVLMAEREHLRQRFTPRDGGMRGIPKSVRNRILRLEKVIGIKTEVYKRAMEQANESGRISENT